MNKKMPMRKCLGCGEMFLQKELVRVVKTKIKNGDESAEEEYEISLDLVGKKPGRGAYVCRSVKCLKLCKDKKRLNNAFSCQIPDEVYDSLIGELSDAE